MEDKKEKSFTSFWKRNRYFIIASIAVVLVFLIFIQFLSRAGWLTLTGTESSTTIVAASIALIGGLFGSIVSLLGLALKHSVDERSLAIQVRNEALAKEAELRLNNEAAIQSIGLLSTSNGDETSSTQRAGVILSLANLNKFAIALSLADEMMNDTERPLNTGTFCWLISKSIVKGDNLIKEQAALSFSEQIYELNDKMLYPAALLDVDIYRSLDDSIRILAVEILVDYIIARPFVVNIEPKISSLLNTLYGFWIHEKIENTKNLIGISMHYLLKVIDKDQHFEYYKIEEKQKVKLKVMVEDMIKEFSLFEDWVSNGVSYVNKKNRVENLIEWTNAYLDKE